MAKVDPYLRPLFDALHDMIDPERVSAAPRARRDRGRAAGVHARAHAQRLFVILDEAQNTTPEQMKMFLTRLGFGSKMVVTGDVTQIDLPREQQSGLVVVSDILDEVEGIEFVRFGGEDVVRHKLVQRIVEAYAEHASARRPSCAADRRQQAGRCSRSRSSARRRVVDELTAPDVERAGRARARVGGGRRRPRRRRVRRRATGSQSSTASTAARTGRPTCCRSRSTGRGRDVAGAARARRRRDLPASTPRTCARRSSTASCTSSGMDHETDDGEMLALQAELCVGAGVTRRVDRARGFVALAGRPNVGKSTLVNAIVGRKVAIVSDKPQTTRRAIRGVATGDDSQLVLVDLPGVQRPRDALTERMQRRVEHELADADAALFVLNGEQGVGPGRPLHRRALLARRRGAGDHRGQQGRPLSAADASRC